MKKTLSLLCLILLVASCQFTGHPSETSGPGADISLEGILGKLKGLADKAMEKGWIDTTRAETTSTTTALEEDTPAGPQEPDTWYGKDFSLTATKHLYLTPTKATPEGDAVFKLTRIGNKAWLKVTTSGITQYSQTFEYEDGVTTAKMYRRGKLVSTSPAPGNSLGMRLSWILTGDDIPVAKKRSAATVKSTKDGTYLGRPCRIVEETADLAGSSVNRTVYIDKEYGFIYKMRSTGSISAGRIDVTPFEITAFTDKPTTKEIPDITR